MQCGGWWGHGSPYFCSHLFSLPSIKIFRERHWNTCNHCTSWFFEPNANTSLSVRRVGRIVRRRVSATAHLGSQSAGGPVAGVHVESPVAPCLDRFPERAEMPMKQTTTKEHEHSAVRLAIYGIWTRGEAVVQRCVGACERRAMPVKVKTKNSCNFRSRTTENIDQNVWDQSDEAR